tara:strand:+ start:3296 stop:3850 length:555 start_codon:yes stop_codon:yes gene_type:complete
MISLNKVWKLFLQHNSQLHIDGSSWTFEDAEARIASEFQLETPLTDIEKSVMMKNYDNGGDKVIKPTDEGANYLDGKFCQDNEIETLTIDSNAKLVQTDFEDKNGNKIERVKVDVICDDKDKTKKTWSMNKTSRNMVIKVLGTDETQWIGKQVPIVIQPTDKGPAIFPNGVRFEKMYATKGTLD